MQLITGTDKTNAADLSIDVFALFVTFNPMKKNTKFIAIAQISSKTGKQWCNKGSTQLYCLFIAADTDSIVDAIRRIVLWFTNKFSQIVLRSDLSF